MAEDFGITLPSNWKQRFFTIWAGQAVSLVGSGLVQFALVWYLTQSTGSATILATATLVAMLPQVVAGPLIGALVDRWNRRTIMMVADSAIAGVTLILAVLFATGNIQVWHIYVAMLLRSLGGAFHWPAMSASTSLMVPKEHLSRIAGMNDTLQGVVSIITPPISAFLLMLLPIEGILLIDVITALTAVVPLFFISIPLPPRIQAVEAGQAVKTSVWQDFIEGLRYVAAWPALLVILIMATMLNFLFNPAFSLLPLLVSNHFKGGAVEYGLMESVIGIGIVIGGITLSVWGGFKQRIVTTMFGLIGMGIGILMIGFAPANMYWLALAGIGLLGIMNPLTNGPLRAIFQGSVAPEMQGRVFGLISSLAALMSPLGLLIAGPVSDALGIQLWFVAAGILSVAAGAVMFFVPLVMNVEKDRRVIEAAAPTGAIPAVTEAE